MVFIVQCAKFTTLSYYTRRTYLCVYPWRLLEGVDNTRSDEEVDDLLDILVVRGAVGIVELFAESNLCGLEI